MKEYKSEIMNPDLFLRMKPTKALIALSNKSRTWYAHLLAKEIDCSYAHLVKVLDAFAEDDMVIFQREGRVKLVNLTDYGQDVAHDLESVLRRLEKPKKAKGKD